MMKCTNRITHLVGSLFSGYLAVSSLQVFPSLSYFHPAVLIAGINLLLENGSFIKCSAWFLGPFPPLVSVVCSNEQNAAPGVEVEQNSPLWFVLPHLLSSPGWSCSAQKCQLCSWREAEWGSSSTSKTAQV